MATIMLCHSRMLQMGDRVFTSIKIDDRRDRPADMEGKVRSVQERLAKG